MDSTGKRGHSEKIFKKRCNLELRKNFFSNRIVDIWNNLPQHIIDADTVYNFEVMLHKHWKNICFKI